VGSTELHAAARDRYADAIDGADGVRVDEAAFVEWVVAAIAGEHDPHAALAALHAADLLVARAAVAGDRAAIAQVDARLREQAAAVVRGLGESSGFASELEANLLAHVLVPRDGTPARLAGYSGRGPLDGWLRVTATREALRARTQAGRMAGNAGELDELPAPTSPELEYLATAYREPFRAAFREALHALDDRQQNLIRLHYRDGVGVERLGKMYRVHFSTISRWIAAAREQMFEHTRAAVRARLGLDDAEFAELMELVRSRLDVTISLFVRDDS
jgi:RNA polymerase sigma-70 factor, ECF subfamily